MSMTLAQRDEQLQQLRASLRPGQQALADWAGGPLAVSAVPGSGKSTGMAAGAAMAIAKFGLHARQQLVLVTFTRSAAANLKAKVRSHLEALRLPQNSFTVSTLHGLALNIASRNPELSGLNLEGLTLVSPNQSHRLMRAAVEQWIVAEPDFYRQLILGQQFDGEETERLRRQSTLRTEVLPKLAYTLIHEAKSSGLTPGALTQLADRLSRAVADQAPDYDVLAMAAGLYQRYQDLLQRRGFIDYDDMILAALRVLDEDEARQFWQARVFAVFEDEAQDSSPLQTRLLELLAAEAEMSPSGRELTQNLAQSPAQSSAQSSARNLVRVGDPNQAINSTFTPADPVFFNQFCDRCAAENRLATIAQAGRSTAPVMDAANFVLTWVNQQLGTTREAPFRPQQITPVGADDPQADANPAPWGQGVEIHRPATIQDSIQAIAQRTATLLQDDPQAAIAILVRENRQGRYLHEKLCDRSFTGIDFEALGIRLYDVAGQERQSHIPAEMLALLQFLQRPHSPDYLKAALKVLVDRQRLPAQDLNRLISQPEQFLYPGPLDPPITSPPALAAHRLCTGLLRARLELPPYHLISFLAFTLAYDQSELATADKLAARLIQQTRRFSSLGEMIGALQDIVSSERFEAVDAEDAERQYTRPGQITLITMHKAKGLDWDAVFLPFLHSRQIPGESWVPAQAQFLGDFSLDEVGRAQLRAYTHNPDGEVSIPDLPTAWQAANTLKQAEEYRLLYVAMTRAKRLLWLSAAQQAPFNWAKPDSNLQTAPPCPVLPALEHYLSAPS